jgi:hypothetical protein
LLMLYILFSFPSSPDFHKVFPQLQTCSTYMFVYDHVCLVYIFIFGSIFHTWKKICGLCLFEHGLLQLTWCPLIASIYLQKRWSHSSLWLNKTVIYIYIYIYNFLDAVISCWTSGWFL